MNENELTPSEHADVRARLIAGAGRITPVGRHRNAWITGSVAVALVAVIAGGVGVGATLSAPPVMSTPSPSATPAPTLAATPTPIDTPQPTPTGVPAIPVPQSRFAFDCDDIAPDASGLFGGSIPVTVSTIPEPRGNLLAPGPMQYAYAQAGAVYCEYGEPSTAWATLAVVPEADGVLEHQKSILGNCENSVCEVVDGTYISVTGQRMSADEGSELRAVLDEAYAKLRARVVANPPAPATWQPPAGSVMTTGDCADVLAAEPLSRIYGEEVASESVGWGGWSLRSWMLFEYWNTDGCVFYGAGQDPMSGTSFGSITWLPGGEWAFEQAVSGNQLPVARASGSDRALASCVGVDVSRACAVDVLAAGNWVRYALPSGIDEALRASLSAQVADAIIETIRG